MAESSYIKTTLYDLSQRLQQPNAASFFTVNQSRSSVVQAWNNVLNNSPIDFGDVIGLSVNRFAVANQNYNGANTWVTRNEEPVREAIGWLRGSVYDDTKRLSKFASESINDE